MLKIIDEIIKKLDLEPHCEGGYFKEIYRSKQACAALRRGEQRQLLTSIYYLLSAQRPISYFARNQSDLILYFHSGDPVKIITLNDEGQMQEFVMGSDILAGQQPQVVIPGECCKAYELLGESYCLVGEAVSPGFDYSDMMMPKFSEYADYLSGDARKYFYS